MEITKGEKMEGKRDLTVLKEFMTPQDMSNYFQFDKRTFENWEEKGLKVIKVSNKAKFYKADDIRNFMESMR